MSERFRFSKKRCKLRFLDITTHSLPVLPLFGTIGKINCNIDGQTQPLLKSTVLGTICNYPIPREPHNRSIVSVGYEERRVTACFQPLT